MKIYPPFLSFYSVLSAHRRDGMSVWLRVALLSIVIISPAFAMKTHSPTSFITNKSVCKDCSSSELVMDSLLASHPAPALIQNKYSAVLGALEASPDVAVFPIWVAGPVVASASANLRNKFAQAGEGGIAVLYPDIGEPYRSIFTQIIDGIEEKAKGRVTNIAVGSNVDAAELNNSLRRKDTKVVIALGRQGMKAASALDKKIGVVVGGVLTSQEAESRHFQINSLSPDPALLFSRLKSMMPHAKRIFVVYDPRQNTWMIRLAKEAARTQGIELVTFEAQDLRSAMFAYQEIMSAVDSRQDAIWLPQDSTTVEDSLVLPMVLQESWKRNLAVFSSSFGHVKRGVLFSLYPNNLELGRYLAGSALGFMASGGNDEASLFPLREVLMAVNLRTAKHLDINASRAQGFDMAFPEQ